VDIAICAVLVRVRVSIVDKLTLLSSLVKPDRVETVPSAIFFASWNSCKGMLHGEFTTFLLTEKHADYRVRLSPYAMPCDLI
jgi:hypothetical protein